MGVVAVNETMHMRTSRTRTMYQYQNKRGQEQLAGHATSIVITSAEVVCAEQLYTPQCYSKLAFQALQRVRLMQHRACVHPNGG